MTAAHISSQLSNLQSQHPNLKINDLSSLTSKLFAMQADGSSALSIMADFDFTITKRWQDKNFKNQCPSTYGVIKRSPLIEKSFASKMNELFNKYWPIETDPNMTVMEKTPHIQKWILSEIALMVECELTKNKLEMMLESNGLIQREGFAQLCKTIEGHGMPLIISTAGLADVVRGAMLRWHLLTDNVAIIGNWFSWDEGEVGVVTGFKGDLVHTLNKETSMRKFFDRIEDETEMSGEERQIVRPRQNVVLLGDSLGDVRMTFDLKFLSHILTIGFLNDAKPDSKMDAYLKNYDIVLVNDDTMNVPQLLVNLITDVTDQLS